MGATGTTSRDFPTAGVDARWLACGHSADPDAFAAGAEAAGVALRHPNPKLLIIFCSEAYDLEALVRGIRSLAPGTPLVGCSTAGEIATAGPKDADG